MKPEMIIERICTELVGVTPKASWGETSLFYNPGKVLPNGVYFCTIKEKDGANDQASNLNRDGIFRVAIGLVPKTYVRLFGQKPPRPAKGGVISTDHDFTKSNELMPHPIYAWMYWSQILSPKEDKFEEIWPLISEAHLAAIKKFAKKTANKLMRTEGV